MSDDLVSFDKGADFDTIQNPQLKWTGRFHEYTVKSDESLDDIILRFKVPRLDFIKLNIDRGNMLSDTDIHEGQTLLVPEYEGQQIPNVGVLDNEPKFSSLRSGRKPNASSFHEVR